MPTSRGLSAGVKEFTTLEASQRLNANDLTYAYLVGLFEGDGFFTVSKKGVYFQCELGIELSIKDVQLIYKIKDLLGVGVVGFRDRTLVSGVVSKMVYFKVRKKDHLINNILPIFDNYPPFSNKQFDYLRMRTILLSTSVLYNDIPKYVRPSLAFNTMESILKTPYFSA